MYLRSTTLRYLLFALGAFTALSAFGQLSVTVGSNGNTVFVTAGGGTSSNTDACTTTIAVDGVEYFSGGNAPPCTRYPQETLTVTCLTAGVHVVSAYSSTPYMPTSTQISHGQQTVTMGPPPAFCNFTGGSFEFDPSTATPLIERRILISNSHLDAAGAHVFPYPRLQGLLAKDGQMLVSLRTIFNGAQTSGIPVTLRIIDPPDPSPYVTGGPNIVLPVPGNTLSHTGDNVGGLATLQGSSITDNGNGTYSATSGANGYIGMELHLPERPTPTPQNPNPSYSPARAGDNYQIEVTATFPDGSTRTGVSAIVTAWKRLFLEKRQMFRRGVPLATNAPAGATQIVVPSTAIASAGVTAFARNDTIMLLHAPPYGQPKTASAFYNDVYQIVARPQRFRATAPVTGAGTITTNGTINIIGSGTRFRRLNVGDTLSIGPDVRIIAAIASDTALTVDSPTTTAAANQSYTVGDPYLVPGTYYRRFTLDRPLSRSYVREPLVAPNTGILTLNDAVVRLQAGSLTQADYFDTRDDLLYNASLPASQQAFRLAFTEYVPLPSPPGATPLPREVLTTTDKVTQQFIDKWFSLPTPTPVPSTSTDPLDSFTFPTPPNHQLLLVADTEARDITQSSVNGFLSRQIAGERASVVNRGTVEFHAGYNISPLFGAFPDTVLSRTQIHELTHQWMVNLPVFPNAFDHCHPEVAYDGQQAYPPSGTPPAGLRFCLMSYPDLGPSMPAPWDTTISINMIQYFYRDGFTSYHIAPLGGGWNSEYLSIRNVSDPWKP